MSGRPQIIELADGTKCVSLDDFRKLERELKKLRNNDLYFVLGGVVGAVGTWIVSLFFYIIK